MTPDDTYNVIDRIIRRTIRAAEEYDTDTEEFEMEMTTVLHEILSKFHADIVSETLAATAAGGERT